MAIFKLSILDKNKNILETKQEMDEVSIAYRGYYQEGDMIQLVSDTKDIYVKLRLDDSLEESIVYLADYEYCFSIPFGDLRKPYGKKAFTEERHWGYVSKVDDKEFNNYRNLALNAFDFNDNQSIYPHATTNVTTTNPQFFARNAIDGIFETCNHGSWPHSSWGINKQEDAWLKIDFGNTVEVDEVLIYLRADFPHDNWWKQIKLTFSNGEEQLVSLEKTGKAQHIPLERKKIEWIMISDLVMSDDESLFPALSQIKVMGNITKL